ncbi:chitooligosaccharidolytic beta-N-acetylglucosaminidase-like isoform X3 [Macrobrachium rosenbergii]|uniref:chitooligosaccharidolytic beta-N-acetylglucosaminidase-like isoform X3 n=1 Tax=Macrobrachium rosenbergii TaxID=79674 RepID=UPI0034D5989A
MADSRDVKNQILFSLLFTASLLHSALSDFPFLSPYSWSCVNETCVKNLKGWNEEDAYSLSTCKLTCGQHGVLWPKPTRLTQISNQTVHFNLSRLSLEEAMAPTQEVKDLLQKAFDIFKGNVAKGVPEPDERFFRKIFDSDEIVSQVAVVDKPAFRYRGILLDTASNFISVRAIERTLDAMAANKLNTLHWHITDTASFPLYLKSLPDMSYFGSYSQRQIYNTSDVSHVVEYARVRGIRVVPEFSAPGHVGNGWQWTEKKGLGKMAVCVKQEPWSTYCTEPPCGQLNIANNNTYGILTQIYEEMADIFAPLDLFHFGGQEVNLNCWNTTEEIVSHLTERGLNQSVDSFLDLWSEFQSNVYNMFPADNQTGKVQGILWNSQLTSAEKADKYLDPRKYIIQASGSVKDQRVIGDLLKKGYHVILSNSDAWFLNCGFGSWVTKGQHPCGSYKGWQAVYDNSPHDVASNETGSYQKKLLLGGEAVLWSQQVDDASLDAKLWPRGAALAERLWTNPKHNWEPAEIRFIHQRQRLFQRGVMADRIQPEWCHQNEKLCYLR